MSAKPERRRLGRTGLEVSVLGFGGAEVGFLETDRREVAALLNALLDAGVNLIDTAAKYGGSEDAIGEAVGHRRDDYLLVSKCGEALDGIEGAAWSAGCITRTIDRSLQRLRTDRLDVMLLHSCDLEVLQAGEALGALVAARDAGKLRYLGYSGDNETVAYAAGLEEVAVIEASINLCDQANIATALPAARAHDVGVLAKRPIANAAWKAAAERRGLYVDYAQSYEERLRKMAIAPEDLGFAAEDWPEIALRFTLSQPDVGSAIVGTTRQATVARNLAAAAKGPLPPGILAALRDAFRRAETADGAPWPGLR